MDNPLVQLDPGLFVWTIITFLILLGLLSKFAWKPLLHALEKRENEINGIDYYFLTKDQFEKKINLNEFIEWEEVYDNTFYGTLKSEINDLNSLGKNLIFDIDAIGGLSIKKEFPKSTLAVFICPPSLKELENRLRKRGTDSEEKIKIRLSKASKEMSMSVLYDYAIENHNLEETVAKVKILINNFL